MKTKKVLCIIPARGGSKRIPRKNIMDFSGKPMISYSITAIREARIADTVMVSTDDEEIAEIAREYGAEVPFFRSTELANDKTGIADVLIDVIEQYRKEGIEFEFTICILATVPLIKKENLVKAFHMLKNTKDADSVCPVEVFSYPPQRCLVIRDGKLRMLYPENYYARSQDLEKQYHDCGQFFIFRTEALLRDKKLYTQNALPFFLNEMESQDIDNYTDLEIAKLKYKLLSKKGMEN